MISSLILLFLFICMSFTYRVLQFILQKISPPLEKNVQVPSLNNSIPVSSSRLCNYDVFLSFRGKDTRKTFVDHLYSALVDRQICTYKDDKTLPRGESIGPSLFKAIRESRIAVIIFSKNYTNSSWCLDELAYIMKCRDEIGLIIMPIFYDVDPSILRKHNRGFGKAFTKQEAENTTKVKSWRKALVDASEIAGWQPKNIANGHESQVIKNIIDSIFNKLFPLNSNVHEDLIGMRARLQELASILDIGLDGVRMVGIWGVGGSGKTTLATSLYMEISHHFQSHCIVENIREESSKYGLRILQENLLSSVFKTEVKVHSVTEGKLMIKRMLCNRKVLLILDDVDELSQLDALAESHDWFSSESRIIITTRDEHVLKTHRVSEIYHVRLLSNDEAIRLFKRHAYNERDPIDDYKILSLRVVSYASGLPLALKILGSFLYDKKKKEWLSTLARLKDIPDMEIVEKLKISYDGLRTVEKELFLDIACFFRIEWFNIDNAMKIFEACDFHPEIGIEVLRQKALITIVDSSFGLKFDMHDLVEEMGHYIIRREHPKNPEKHSRVWKDEEIRYMCLRDITMENDKIEAIHYDNYSNYHESSSFYKIISKMKKIRWLVVTMRDGKCDGGPTFLSNELRYFVWQGYPARPFPHSFQPMNLVVLNLSSRQKELWKGLKHLPHLKVLELEHMYKLLNTPNFDGLPCLQKLTLMGCDELKEIHPSLGNHTSLEYLSISLCPKLLALPKLPSSLAILQADFCDSLTTIVDCYKNCKWLCQVSLMGGSIKTDGGKLLQSMLEGKAAENGNVHLRLQGVDVAKGFTPHLLNGSTCRLKLPVNSCNDFSGFLMCAVFSYKSAWVMRSSIQISMHEVTSGMDSQHEAVWEVTDNGSDKHTCIWFVSLGLLTDTAWWDQTHKSLSFEIEDEYKEHCIAFGVRPIDSKSRSGLRV